MLHQSSTMSRTLEVLVTLMQPFLAFAAVQQQQNPASSSSAPSPHPYDFALPALPRNVKPPQIGEFSGQRRKDTLPWLNRARQILLLSSMPLDAVVTIQYVAAHLTGNALKWWETACSNASMDNKAHAGFLHFDDLATALNNALGESFPEDKAFDRIQSLKQRASVADYGSEFQRVISDLPNMDWRTMRLFYVRGLKPNLLIMITGKFDDDASWNDIHMIAMKHDQASFRPAPPKPMPAARRYDPMDISVINATKPKSHSRPSTSSSKPKPALTEDERERCRLQGLCFYCRKPGHLSTSCPVKDKHEAYTTARKN